MIRIKVEISESRISGIEINPVNARLRAKCYREIVAEHRTSAPQLHRDWNREETERWLRSRPVVLVQTDYEAEDALERFRVTSTERGHMRAGWPVVKIVDFDYFDHLFANSNGLPR